MCAIDVGVHAVNLLFTETFHKYTSIVPENLMKRPTAAITIRYTIIYVRPKADE